MSYTMVKRPTITEAEFVALEGAEERIGGVCGHVRPGTLGYQRCWRISDHDGAHVSQDSGAWVVPESAVSGREDKR